ncbi:hypothetical protein MAR_007358 [Mya arenaria]|uniref:Uncharacterized protein n=1 Tax=Mya arenaria TaxID=6604 RepID=A0ABY7DB61_MYAAR|nr:hypothetical protein MAR_007358 [Mya arenaria]
MSDVQSDDQDARTKGKTSEMDPKQHVTNSETTSSSNDGKADTANDKTCSVSVDGSRSPSNACKEGDKCADRPAKLVRLCEVCAAQDIVQKAEQYVQSVMMN